ARLDVQQERLGRAHVDGIADADVSRTAVAGHDGACAGDGVQLGVGQLQRVGGGVRRRTQVDEPAAGERLQDDVAAVARDGAVRAAGQRHAVGDEGGGLAAAVAEDGVVGEQAVGAASGQVDGGRAGGDVGVDGQGAGRSADGDGTAGRDAADAG